MRISLRTSPVPALALAMALLLPLGTAATLGAPAPIVVAQDEPDQPPEDPASASALLVRIDRLENKLRTLTGQIQELQFQNKKLDDALRKMQQDVDFRFQDLGRGATPPGGKPPLQKRGDADDGSTTAPRLADAAPVEAPATAAISPPVVEPAKPQRRGDAFDPAADPTAPGAPKPLGTTPPSAPLRSTLSASAAPPVPARPVEAPPHAPLDLLHGAATPVPAAVPAGDAVAAIDTAPRSMVPTPDAAPAGGTRSDYEAGYSAYKSGQFDTAVGTLQDFIAKNPRDRAVPDATYFLGESYARLGRQREAAEQFLKLSTDYNRSTHAPDALLRLGVALSALGAKDQACATYQEVGRKYPTASSDVRAGVERELKRARC